MQVEDKFNVMTFETQTKAEVWEPLTKVTLKLGKHVSLR